jgi:predicted kinase
VRLPTLFLICGLPCSGKTTAALTLERDYNAVRLAPDEWMARIVGDGWDHERREAVEKVQWALAQRLLTLGLNVVLENGFWRRTERQAYRARASELGADSKLIYAQQWRDVHQHKVGQAGEFAHLDDAQLKAEIMKEIAELGLDKGSLATH